jgi:hypothetical protein
MRTGTPLSAFSLIFSIPSFSYFLSALAREKIIGISSMADDKTFEIRDVVSSESGSSLD